MVPRAQMDLFVRLADEFVTEQVPGYASSGDCTGIISERHLDRVQGLLDEAASAGVRVVPLGGDPAVDRTRRQMPVTLVVDPPAGLGVMTAEHRLRRRLRQHLRRARRTSLDGFRRHRPERLGPAPRH